MATARCCATRPPTAGSSPWPRPSRSASTSPRPRTCAPSSARASRTAPPAWPASTSPCRTTAAACTASEPPRPAAGYDAAVTATEHEALETIDLSIAGLRCANCAITLEKALVQVPGVAGAAVNFASETARVQVQAGALGRG
ncbi:MAG: cation transporter, partial [Nannocystis sp.]|nr:cation transporter [Nannocystis sp.]